jgi:CheY-like chemotaxis protein
VVLGPGVPRYVLGDGLRLRQVLANLVGNAVKFTTGGSVTVSVVAREGALRFEVADTGVGISPEVQDRLFQPFQQGDASTTRRFGGTGLGLALARELVTLMEGRIGLASTPGSGSIFWFEVPLAPSEAPPPLAAPASPDLPPPPGSRLLVVDDNEINLTVARALLERAGCQVDVARDGQQALEAVARTPYALVLMDCQMPVLDGFEATRRIRQLPGAAGRTPVVALTASAMSEELAACRAAGMDDCLTKPFGWDQLQRLLATWLPREPGAPASPPATTRCG